MGMRITFVCGKHNVNLKGSPVIVRERLCDIEPNVDFGDENDRETGYYIFDLSDAHCPEEEVEDPDDASCITHWVTSMHLEPGKN